MAVKPFTVRDGVRILVEIAIFAYPPAIDPRFLSEYRHDIWYGTRGQSNLTKSASRGAHSPVRGHPRGSKVVPLNSWGRVSY